MSKTPPQRRLSVRHGRKALGFTLLEVLVALLVLAFGFLAVAGIQLRALKTNFSSAQKSQATMLSYLILDAMRANPRADWRIADVEALCREYGILCEPARGGSSHYKVGHPLLARKLTIPFKRPIKPVYIRALVAFVDDLTEAQGNPP